MSSACARAARDPSRMHTHLEVRRGSTDLKPHDEITQVLGGALGPALAVYSSPANVALLVLV